MKHIFAPKIYIQELLLLFHKESLFLKSFWFIKKNLPSKPTFSLFGTGKKGGPCSELGLIEQLCQPITLAVNQ